MRTGRQVVVTGAAGGIGSALVARFLANGDAVTAADRDGPGLDVLREAHSGMPLTVVRTDVSDEADCAALASAVHGRADRVDVLVNCAGYFPLVPFDAMTRAQWDEVLAINLTGPFLVTKAVLPLMTGRGWGRIVNIGSASTFEGVAGQAHYVTAKAGVAGFSRSLAREVGRHGITVNVVTPGLTLTPPVRDAFPEDMLAGQRELRALPRDEQAADLVGAVFFLASPNADFVTGQTLNVDGGRSMP